MKQEMIRRTMTMKRPIAILFAAWTFMVSCGGAKEGARGEGNARKVQARVETIRVSDVPVNVRVSGTVEARIKSVIASQVMGVIRLVNVEPGQRVNQGQVLVVIDSQQLTAGLAQAEAGRLEASSALLETGAAIEAAATQLELAKSTRARMAKLFERNSLTQQEMDEADARLKQASASLSMAKAKKAQVEARIAQADQVVSSAAAQKGYATLVAPFPGVVIEKVAQVGSMAVPGATLLTIERAGGFRAELQVDEKQAGTVWLGMPLKVYLDEHDAVDAKVNEIVPSLDASTHSLTVKADLPVIRGLRSGAFARGEWTMGKKQMLSVAVSAVRESGQLQMVFVLEGGKARSRMVSLGDANGGRREVLSGLKVGEQVVAELVEMVEDGVVIEAKP